MPYRQWFSTGTIPLKFCRKMPNLNVYELIQIAKNLRDEADRLERIAAKIQAAAADRRQQRHDTVDMIRDLVNQGHDEDSAISIVMGRMVQFGQTAEANMRWLWKRHNTMHERVARATLGLRIADLTAAGVGAAEIARLLSCSPETVRRHRKRILEQKCQRPNQS